MTDYLLIWIEYLLNNELMGDCMIAPHNFSSRGGYNIQRQLSFHGNHVEDEVMNILIELYDSVLQLSSTHNNTEASQ